jgi:myo-inositol-1-phosphate synthase
MSIRVSIIGVGDVAESLIKGIEYYSNNDDKKGLWHPKVGGYSVSDIDIVSLFDIDRDKVGRSIRFNGRDVRIGAGMLYDEPALSSYTAISKDEFISILRASKPDIVINLISSSMVRSSRIYAECSLTCDASFINATPAILATDAYMSGMFKERDLLLVGDDLMSQFGGTVFHRMILNMTHRRGIVVKSSYQLDVGGSNDTKNTLREDIRSMKRSIKTSSINSEVPYDFDLVAGTTEYTDFLDGERVSYYWLYAEGFMGSPIKIDIAMRGNDASNACNILLDVIRAVKYAMNMHDTNITDIINAYGFKKVSRPTAALDAQEEFEDRFITRINK